MYLPTHFEETRLEELHRVIVERPLGALVVHGPHGLDANHLPFELDRRNDGSTHLRAHVARANPLWHEVTNGQEVLVIFRAVDAYISPNWYPSKHETHRQVPTWNYQAVHVHGTITVHDDERYVRGLVARLTRHHEAAAGEARPWKMGDSAPEFIDERLAAIVGIEIAVAKMVGKWKLSQNREGRDRLNAADTLERKGDTATADAMRRAGP